MNELNSISTCFSMIKTLIHARDKQARKSLSYLQHQKHIELIYNQIQTVITTNHARPCKPIKFGTSGWRGIIGDDINCHTVNVVTQAIVEMFKDIGHNTELDDALGIIRFEDVQNKGCVLGFDNRFGNEILAMTIIDVLTANGIVVYYAGEATTGTLSASVLQHRAAFSINLTPSHNPLEYAGFKFNGADAGPASPIITEEITRISATLLNNKSTKKFTRNQSLLRPICALEDWIQLTKEGESKHGLNYETIMQTFAHHNELCVAVDCVHGASRVDIETFFRGHTSDRLHFLRTKQDPTFGGISPEPSSTNMQPVMELLRHQPYRLKLGVIMDPDADRIRFTDGTTEINMNFFGAMAYHYLHEIKHKKGMVAKTVATSNFANAIADKLQEKVFEPRVGFKEFKPVIHQALVCFEESDGITIIGHTPEKDAYIGLLLAIDMTMTLDMNLGEILAQLQKRYGAYYPDKDGVVVSQKGDALKQTLANLDRYTPGTKVRVGTKELAITKVIDIDGHKFILEDHSWFMIRPSGTEPKVRFYVESRTEAQKVELFTLAKNILSELGLS